VAHFHSKRPDELTVRQRAVLTEALLAYESRLAPLMNADVVSEQTRKTVADINELILLMTFPK
jgi:hypothetical protein